MSSHKPKFIFFHNNTDLPINVGAWNDQHVFRYTKINAGIRQLLYSTDGKWHLDSMFQDKEARDELIKQGLGEKTYYEIGEFSSEPCAPGNYVKLEYQNKKNQKFACLYTEINEVNDGCPKGLITFSKIEKKKRKKRNRMNKSIK